MKRMQIFIFAVAAAAALGACSKGSETKEQTGSAAQTQSDTVQTEGSNVPESVKITSLNGNKEEIELEVAYNPQRIAVLDMAALDILDTLGLGDRIVGSANTSLEYLQTYMDNEQIANLGTIKEADMEAVMACEPDVIFIGGRLSASYDALSEIAPVVYLATDTQTGVVESTRENAKKIGSLFGLEEEAEEKMTEFDERIGVLSEFAQGKTAVVGMCTSGSFNILGNDGRCSIIGVEIGFDNIGVAAAAEKSQDQGGEGATSTHGNESSFELLVELSPEYIFVMDRDAAIGTDGAQLAKEILENELVMGIDAYKNGNIVYLDHPAVWYTAEGGITALDMMLSDLEGALLTSGD